jgi:hypothetical protein
MSFVRTAGGFLLLGAAIFAQDQRYDIFTFAGGAPPPTPVRGVNMAIGSVQSVAVDAMGNTYFATFQVADTYEGFLASSQGVRRISPDGTITTRRR